jgi:hypothetical protein
MSARAIIEFGRAVVQTAIDTEGIRLSGVVLVSPDDGVLVLEHVKTRAEQAVMVQAIREAASHIEEMELPE